MKSKILLMLVLLAFIAAGIPACSLLKKRSEKKERTEYKITGKNKTGISIENTNGEIKVSKSDDTLGVITINAEKIARVRKDDIDKPIENLNVNIDTSGSTVKVTTEYQKVYEGWFNHDNNAKVNYDVRVPANMKVDVDNTNGAITLSSLAGDIKVETTNGSTTMNKCSGYISVDGVNGSISGNFDSTKGISIGVVNGAVKLGGMKNISAEVSASTTNGKVKFNNLSFSNMNVEKRSLSGTLGSGKNIIKVTSVNGSITFDAGDVVLSKDKNEDFNFKIDFGDDDNDRPKKKENAKQVDTPKAPEAPKTK
jgi:hypothetical protein